MDFIIEPQVAGKGISGGSLKCYVHCVYIAGFRRFIRANIE